MRPKTAFGLLLGVLFLVSIGCGKSASVPTPAPIDTQATVDAAVAATAQAQTALQATVDASVAATAASVSPTSVVSPTPAVEYVTMTEEELEALINQSVAQANAATAEVASETTQTTTDDTITQEELDAIYGYYYLADESLAYAYEVLYAYYDLYAELAEESIQLLEELEADLAGLTGSLETINSSLQEINSSLQQGAALAEESITQLETAAQEAQAKAAEAQTNAQTWATTAQADRESRVQAIQNAQPDNPPKNFRETLQSTVDFVDSVKAALGDNKLTREELDLIGKLSANASAGLQAFGGADFQVFAGNITEITSQLARGQVPRASEGIQSFDFSLNEKGKALPGGLPKPRRR